MDKYKIKKSVSELLTDFRRPVGTIFEPLFGGFEEIGFRKKLLIPAKYGG